MTKADLVKLAARITADSSSETIAQLMDSLVELTGAERGFFLKENDRVPFVARNIDGEDVASAAGLVSDTILKQAVVANRPVVLADALSSQFRIQESVSRQKLRSVIVFPLKGVGVFYLDSSSRSNLFDDETVALMEELAKVCLKSLERARLMELKDREIENLKQRISVEDSFEGIIGKSPAMKSLYGLIDKAAKVDYPVLIWGETGAGKELTARAIHARSKRAGRTLLEVNCGAITDTLLASELFGHEKGAFTGADRDRAGLFEAANGSTLFLDEIEAMSERLQDGLLRIVETGIVRRVGSQKPIHVDVRMVCATNENPERLVKDQVLREDLFYRLNVLNIHVPSLRERKEDIPVLADYFLQRIAGDVSTPRRSLSKEALERLIGYDWPGNVRQLENTLKSAVVLSESDVLTESDFRLLGSSNEEMPLITIDEYIKRAVEVYSDKMDVKELAQRLGISRKSLWERKRRLAGK